MSVRQKSIYSGVDEKNERYKTSGSGAVATGKGDIGN
jgi:hypothetical protein